MRLRPLCAALLTSLVAGALVAAAATPATDSRDARAGGSLVPSLPERAVARALIENGQPQLEARLVVSREPDRQIGVLFELAPGWHVYWRHPGDTGIAPRLDLAAPGYDVGEIVWPAPLVFEEADGLFTTYGYESRVLLGAPLRQRSDTDPDAGPEGSAPDSASVQGLASVQGEVLVCRTECVPASFSLSTALDVELPAVEQARIDQAFAEARRQAPVPSAQLGLKADAQWVAGSPAPDGQGRIRLAVRSCQSGSPSNGLPRKAADCPAPAAVPTAPAATHSPLFIPFDADTLELSESRLVSAAAAGDAFALEIAALRLDAPTDSATHANDGRGDAAARDRLHGLVAVRDAQGALQHVEIDVEIDPPVPSSAGQAGVGWTGWMQIFALALLGGLILNGMPCVLPVLAIKVFAVADLAEKDPRDVRLHGLVYTLGVLASMALLAAVVVALRTAGHSVGWGFQFQEPLFVAAISAIIVAFALNLFGVYEIELGQGRLASLGQASSGLRRSFFEGGLAVVLATPCTAPFLGTAVGFAFASSGLGIVSIFLAIGLGLASPFLAVSFVPGLARFIPRSGPWMLKLRAALGFSLLATTVWLLFVLGQSGGTLAIVQTVAVLLGLSFLLWIFGQLQPIRSLGLGRLSAAAILALSVAGLNWIELERAPVSNGSRAAGAGAGAGEDRADEDGWQPWSDAAVADALAAGRPAFVVFTADWCLTCKVNERTVLAREAVRSALDERGYARFEADWTRRDETIRRKLAEFGRAGVPLYLVYTPDAPSRPRVLSELLSQREVLAALGVPITFSSKQPAEETMQRHADSAPGVPREANDDWKQETSS